MNDWGGFETWGPPLVVLGAGVLVGLIVALRSRGDADPALELRIERDALLAQKQSLLERIRSLDADRGRLTDADWQRQRDELIDQAAAVLANLDAVEEGSVERPSGELPAASASGSRAGWALAVVAFFGLLGVGLTEFTRPRNGGSMTGGDAVEAANASRSEAAASPARAAATQRLADARAAVEASPDSLEALNALTYEALLLRDFQTAMQTVEQARQLDPSDPDVQVHLGILQLAVGMTDRAEPLFEGVVQQHPSRGKPLLWLGLLQLQTDRRELATATLERAIGMDLRADEAAFARSLLMEAKQPATAARPPTAAASSSSMSTDSDASSEPRLSGVVRLDESVQAEPSQRVFLIAHRNAEGAGPPLAVRPMMASELPYEFALTDSDQMMSRGQPWPEQVWIFARLDADGVAGASDGDVESQRLGPFSPGHDGLELVIAP